MCGSLQYWKFAILQNLQYCKSRKRRALIFVHLINLIQSVTTLLANGSHQGRQVANKKGLRGQVYQHTSPISPGNSGGPLFVEGTKQVLGINFATAAGAVSQQNNFAIPSWRVQQRRLREDAEGRG